MKDIWLPTELNRRNYLSVKTTQVFALLKGILGLFVPILLKFLTIYEKRSSSRESLINVNDLLKASFKEKQHVCVSVISYFASRKGPTM